MIRTLAAALATSTCIVALATPAAAQTREYSIPAGSLKSALDTYVRQSGRQIVYRADQVRLARSPGTRGQQSAEAALAAILAGSGFTTRTDGNLVAIVREGNGKIAGDDTSSRKEGAGIAAADGETDQIVVTGSRIARSSKSIPGSVTILDRERIERSGETSVRGVIALSSQTGTTPTPLSSFLGAAPIQLRGLSTGTTLVLIDGRRVTPSGATGEAFDVGSIPLSAVERIEVLADGASAIYGADAVGGIINVILNRARTGLIVEGRLGVSQGGVGEERRLSSTFGFTTGALRGSITADYLDTGGIRYRDRARTRDVDYRRFGGNDFRLPYTNQGTVYSLDGSNLPGLSSDRAAIPITSNGRPTLSDFAATDGQEVLGSDYYQQRELQAPVERIGAVVDLEYQLGEQTTAFVNVLGSRQNGRYTAVLPFIVSGIAVPASNPFNPFGVDVGVNRLLTGVAPNVNRSRDTFVRALGGVRGRVSGDLRWEAAINYSRDDNKVHEENFFDLEPVIAALGNTNPAETLNLFATGPVGSESLLQSLLPPVDKRYLASALAGDVQLSGTILQLSGGSLSFALGAEARHETLSITSTFDNTAGKRDVMSGYLELRAPVLATLTITGAGRYDHYSDFGSSFNPKLGIEWSPVRAVTLSGSWGTSYRAPPLAYLNSVPFTVPLVVNDIARGGETAVVPTTLGGNAGLKPETADSLNIGARFVPIDTGQRQLSLSVSAWWVSQDERLVTPNTQTLVDFYQLFPQRVFRSAPTAQDVALGQPGTLLEIDSSYINFGSSKTHGIDAQLSYRAENNALRWSLDASVTRVLGYKAEVTPGAREDRLASFSFDGFAPKWRGSATGALGYAGFDLAATIRYIGRYEDRRDRPYEISARAFVDVQVSYTVPAETGALKGLRLTTGATNILGTQPPFFNDTYSFDPSNYDVRGRTLYASIRKSF
jgi:iron complex outermembrane receptor protein